MIETGGKFRVLVAVAHDALVLAPLQAVVAEEDDGLVEQLVLLLATLGRALGGPRSLHHTLNVFCFVYTPLHLNTIRSKYAPYLV